MDEQAKTLFVADLPAFLPAAFLTIILFICTNLEDKTLQEELNGYGEYAGQVGFRSLPGGW